MADDMTVRDEAELIAEQQELLRRVGPAEFARLYHERNPGMTSDYTAERHALIGHLTLDDISQRIEAAERRNAEREGRSPRE